MYTLTVGRKMSDAAAAELAGTLLCHDSYDVLVSEDAIIERPDGSPLLIYRANVFTLDECREAHRGLRDAARATKNRGTAAGPVTTDLKEGAVLVDRTRVRRTLDDGTLSNTVEAQTVHSGIVGSWDRSARTPYCRLTAWTMENPEKFHAALPLVQKASQTFKELCPARWRAQRDIIAHTSPDFVIPGTVFTTVTVNRNWQTAVHQDKGDLKAGYGVMCALRSGSFTGGCLCFPQYRVAVDMRNCGLLLADVHEWHGNTPLHGQTKDWERISLVLYYREKMLECGSHAEELQRVQHRHRGERLRGRP